MAPLSVCSVLAGPGRAGLEGGVNGYVIRRERAPPPLLESAHRVK